jgi:hypothetical protein
MKVSFSNTFVTRVTRRDPDRRSGTPAVTSSRPPEKIFQSTRWVEDAVFLGNIACFSASRVGGV